MRIKRPRREVYHSPSSSCEIKLQNPARPIRLYSVGEKNITLMFLAIKVKKKLEITHMFHII